MEKVIFVDGIDVKKLGDNWYSISFSEKFIEFYNNNKNEKGFLNTNLCKSKDKDKYYLKLNTWKPEKKSDQVTEHIVEFGEDEIPF